MKKLVKESLNETLKMEGHEYVRFHINNGDIYACKEGILGEKRTFIPWNIIRQIMKKVVLLFF